MATKKIVVDFTSLDSTIRTLQNQINDFAETINYLQKNGKFSSSEWSGDAANNYNSSMDSYIKDLNNLKEVFSRITKYINTKYTDYSSLDRLK